MRDAPDAILRCERIDKAYPGTKALDQVSFDLLRGKVNVLIGENGAGKSTLMKMIAGIERPTAGKIYLEGEEVSFRDANDARARGIGIIHQELSLFPALTVYQNIYMCRERTRGPFLDDRRHREGAAQVLRRLEHEISPRAVVGDLRVGQQQMVEIARNLVDDDLKILIMDEPTSSLSAAEVEVLFKIVRELLEQGLSIVYISHRLEEIMEIGDHVTVLRDGRYVADADVADVDLPWIIERMVGRSAGYHRCERAVDLAEAEKVLEVRDMCLPKPGGGWLLDDVSLHLKRGEVLGIYGLLGSGRTELFECLMGMRPEHSGEVLYRGTPMEIGTIADQSDAGFALVPEDRQGQGLVQSLDICKNISLASLWSFCRGPFIDRAAEEGAVDAKIAELRIKTTDEHLPILSLSGGNQQKVVIAKGLMTCPEVLLMDEPSRGIDIGAKTEVFELIHELAEQGLSIVVISSELKEIMAIADRIYVLSNGRCTAELEGREIDEDALVRASYAGLGTSKGGSARQIERS